MSGIQLTGVFLIVCGFLSLVLAVAKGRRLESPHLERRLGLFAAIIGVGLGTPMFLFPSDLVLWSGGAIFLAANAVFFWIELKRPQANDSEEAVR